MGASLVKQVANATNDVAGDGELFIFELSKKKCSIKHNIISSHC